MIDIIDSHKLFLVTRPGSWVIIIYILPPPASCSVLSRCSCLAADNLLVMMSVSGEAGLRRLGDRGIIQAWEVATLLVVSHSIQCMHSIIASRAGHCLLSPSSTPHPRQSVQGLAEAGLRDWVRIRAATNLREVFTVLYESMLTKLLVGYYDLCVGCRRPNFTSTHHVYCLAHLLSISVLIDFLLWKR